MTEPLVSSCRRVRLLAPITSWVAFLAARELHEGAGDIGAGDVVVLAPQLGQQSAVALEQFRGQAGLIPAVCQPIVGLHVYADELAVGPLGEPRRPPDEVLAARRPGEGHDDPLPGLPRVGDAVPAPVVLERLVDPVGHPQQGQLAEGGQVPDPEVVPQGGVDLLRGVDVAVGHAPAQRLGRHVDQLHLLGRPHDLVGDGLPLGDPGDALHHVVERLQVLDVHRGHDVDPDVEQLVDVLPPLGVAGAGHVGVGQLVDQGQVGPAGEDRVDVHLLEDGVPVGDELAGTTSRSCTWAAVASRPWVSTSPTTTSVPRSRRRRPSLSMAKVLPTPGAAPR